MGGQFCGREGLTAPQGECAEGFYCLSGSDSEAPTEGFDNGYQCSLTLGCGYADLLVGSGASALACNDEGAYASPYSAWPSGGPDAHWLGISRGGYFVPGFYDGGGDGIVIEPAVVNGTNTTVNVSLPLPPSKGDICPRGHYCEAGSAYPKPCLAGSFNSEFGGVNASSCEPCLGGFFCPNSSIAYP